MISIRSASPSSKTFIGAQVSYGISGVGQSSSCVARVLSTTQTPFGHPEYVSSLPPLAHTDEVAR